MRAQGFCNTERLNCCGWGGVDATIARLLLLLLVLPLLLVPLRPRISTTTTTTTNTKHLQNWPLAWLVATSPLLHFYSSSFHSLPVTIARESNNSRLEADSSTVAETVKKTKISA